MPVHVSAVGPSGSDSSGLGGGSDNCSSKRSHGGLYRGISKVAAVEEALAVVRVEAPVGPPSSSDSIVGGHLGGFARLAQSPMPGNPFRWPSMVLAGGSPPESYPNSVFCQDKRLLLPMEEKWSTGAVVAVPWGSFKLGLFFGRPNRTVPSA